MATLMMDGTVKDINDVAVPGALVYIYDQPGGLADLQDSMGQSATNPVTTGEDGYWSAYVTTDRYYTRKYYWGGRERLIEANVLVGTSVLGIQTDPNLRTDLAAPSGAALLGFNQSGTGAQDQDLQSRLRKFLLVTDYDTIQHAADALGSGGGDLWFPAGVFPQYTITAPVTFANKANIRLIGTGSVISATTRIASAYFDFTGCSRVFIEELGFDCAQPSLPTYLVGDYPNLYNVPISFTASSDSLTVTKCVFINLYTYHVYVKDSSNVSIHHNEFRSPLQAQNQQLAFVAMQTVGGRLEVEKNLFLGAATIVNDKSPSAVTVAGLTLNGASLSIQGNFVTHCGRNNAGGHRLGVFDVYEDGENISIANNVALNCREQFCRMSTTTNFEIRNNLAIVAAEADNYSLVTVESASYPTVPHPIATKGRIENNDFRDPSHRQSFAIGLPSYDYGGGVIDMVVAGNKLSGFDVAIYGQGPCDGVNIHHNRADDVRAFFQWVMQDSGGTDLTFTTTLGTQAASKIDGISIDDNIVNIRSGSTLIPVTVSSNRTTAYTGTVGTITMRRNTITGASPGTTTAFNIYLNASVVAGRFIAEGNTISGGYTAPFLLRSMVRAVLRNNFIPGLTALLNGSSSSYGTLDAEGNRKGDGLRSGSLTLIAGTRTVSTTEIMAGDLVVVRRVTPGGTIGADVVCNPANHVAGTSLRIDAIDTSGATVTTDTSTVYWEIIR